MKVNSDIGLLPPDPACVYLTYPANYHKHHLSIHKNGLSLSTTYLPTYLHVPPL